MPQGHQFTGRVLDKPIPSQCLPCSSLIIIQSALLDIRSGHVSIVTRQAHVFMRPSELKFSTLVSRPHWRFTIFKANFRFSLRGWILPGPLRLIQTIIRVRGHSGFKGTRLIGAGTMRTSLNHRLPFPIGGNGPRAGPVP